MLQDKLGLFQDGVAIATASTEVDTGSANQEFGLLIHVGGTSIAATGDIVATLTSSATSGGTYGTDLAVSLSAAELMAGVTFSAPSHAKRFQKVAFTGTSISGTVNCGLTQGGQTNL